MRNEIEDLKQQAVEQAKQQLKNMAKESAKKVGQQIWSAIAPVLPYIIIGLIILIIIVGCVDWGTIESSAIESQISYTSSNTNLIDYLLNFGGDSTTYEIDGREFYKTYDDTIGYLTVGLDVYIDGKRAGFEVPGYVSDTISGPSKLVNNVYEYAMSKFNSGITVLIEKELCDKNAEEIRDQKMARVDNLERELGTKFSMQQRYALCAVYYRRSRNVGFYSGVEECK